MTENSELQAEQDSHQKILVADDEASIRRILEARLSMIGYDIITATDGEEAIAAFNKYNPDLIVLDVMMPKIDGYGVTREIRRTSDVPIIILTALGDVSERITGLELGADDYVIKPFSPKELEARGLDFVRYADDLIIMVGSKQAAERVMKSVTRFIEEKLGLKVNAEKSKVDKPKGIKYLGFGFYFDTFAKGYKARPHSKAVAKFKVQMKKLTCRSWGVSNSYKVQKLNQLIRGWINYFKIGSMKGLCERLDSNIRYRLRMCIWNTGKHRRTGQRT